MKTTLITTFLSICGSLLAQSPTTSPATSMPVREVTVFKDGHAYVVRDITLPADNDGTVVLNELPTPVLGTFWPFANGGAKLISAKAGRDTVTAERPAIDLRQIARANIGKDVLVVSTFNERIDAKLLAVPSRQQTDAPNDGDLLLLQTKTGTRVLPLTQVRDIEVRGEFASTVRQSEQRERLILNVTGGGKNAKVGVMYVQKGLRWIPSYRLDIDGEGKAAVQMEATLVNDLVDLDNATVHLVIGVPKFAFEGLIDPISLQQEITQVAGQFQNSNGLSNMLGNSLMTQTASYGRGPAPADGEQPQVDSGEANEDLFVFTVTDVTLEKGERLVLPIASFDLKYRDVYRLDIPFAPPGDMRQNLQSHRVIELAKQMAAPKARHVLRLQNGGDAPLTTAPALVFKDGRVLAQGRITYTPKGATSDLEINVAIDVCVDTNEQEVERKARAMKVGKYDFGKVIVAGTINLHNKKSSTVEVEVTRRVLGNADDVGQSGERKQLDLLQAWGASSMPAWWGWWSWPNWWFAHNGFGEFRWTVKLEPGASTNLEASWHYYWR